MSAIVKVTEYPVNDAVYLVDGIKLALVLSAKEIITEKHTPITAFGDCVPSSVYTENSYKIELVRNITANEPDFSWRRNFTLTVQKPENSILFSNCLCEKIETVRREGEPTAETVLIAARSREVLI